MVTVSRAILVFELAESIASSELACYTQAHAATASAVTRVIELIMSIPEKCLLKKRKKRNAINQTAGGPRASWNGLGRSANTVATSGERMAVTTTEGE